MLHPAPPARRDLLHASACAAVTFLALLIVWPWINLPFNDDWSFAYTVQRLLQSGRLTYNHWSALPIISNAYWGLLWVKCFGFSFTVLRWSTLPLALGSVMLTHALARQAGLGRAYAAFAALLLGTSPLFLPYAACFMTDVPGLFFTLAALYALARSAQSPGQSRVVAWLATGLLAVLIGGIGRQSVFLVGLILFPYLAWLHRARPAAALAAAAGWACTAAVMGLTLRWFARQPHFLADLPLRDDLHRAAGDPLTLLQACLEIGLTAALLCLPALLPGRWLATHADRQHTAPPGLGGARLLLAACIVGGAISLIYPVGLDALAPWMGNTITPLGVLSTMEMFGWRPISLTVNVRLGITAAVLIVLVFDSRLLAPALVQPTRFLRAARQWLLNPQGPVVLPMYGLFLLGYLAALLPRCTRHMVFDRYLLPVIPFVALAAGLRQQLTGRRGPSPLAWALLAFFALFAVVSLQDVTALGRVRIACRNQLLSWGLTPQQIEMGLEFDCWAQLQLRGTIGPQWLSEAEIASNLTPDLHPIARLEYPSPPFTRRIRTLHYTSWLPPFDRTVYLDWVLQPKVIAAPKARER